MSTVLLSSFPFVPFPTSDPAVCLEKDAPVRPRLLIRSQDLERIKGRIAQDGAARDLSLRLHGTTTVYMPKVTTH